MLSYVAVRGLVKHSVVLLHEEGYVIRQESYINKQEGEDVN